jgi:cephalosporin-C deacetylase-like acetyl esterase
MAVRRAVPCAPYLRCGIRGLFPSTSLPAEIETRRTYIRHRHSRFTLLAFGLSLGFVATVGKSAPAQDDASLLRNVASLQTTNVPNDKQAPITQLKEELATLWDKPSASQPLASEVVHTESKNGYKVEGVYINGYNGPAGQDRVFFYYARPENLAGKFPAYIELTGGSGPERSLWMAGVNQGAVLDLEWRGQGNRFRSKWAGADINSMKGLTSLRDNQAFRLVTGIRSAIDFLEQRPEIDAAQIGCGGGSMGGYYTLLAAGVDDRLKFGVDELGAGHLADTDSALGQFELDPERKALWLQAFDPYSYAARTKAKIFMNLSANDYFFWLGDAMANYEVLRADKRLRIWPNFNHNDGAFGKTKELPKGWIDYCVGRTPSYPQIDAVRQQGAVYVAKASAGVTSAELCWSPGAKLDWPARYWAEVPATRTANGWQAEVPGRYARLARYAFMTVRDADGRTVSSLPTLAVGDDPQAAPSPLWKDDALWDTAAGISAWRLAGPNVHSGPAQVTVALDGQEGISVASTNDPKHAFTVVNNSFVLAAGHAKLHAGLVFDVTGNGEAGELTVALVRAFGTVTHQQEFSATIHYGPQATLLKVAWPEFKGPAGAQCISFETLRLDGLRSGGSAVGIRSIRFFD